MTAQSTGTATVTTPMSARVLLFGEDSAARMAERIRESRALDDAEGGWPPLGGATRSLFEDQVAAVADGFVDVDLGQVAVAGWRKHQQLLAAAGDTESDPGLVSVVELAAHTIEASWRPRIEAVLGNAPVAHLEFGLTVAFTLTALSASVRAGRLVALGGGPGRVAARFSVGGQTLAERTAGYDVRLSIPLGTGIRLLGGRHELGSATVSSPVRAG